MKQYDLGILIITIVLQITLYDLIAFCGLISMSSKSQPFSQQFHDGGTIMILQMRKLRLEDITYLPKVTNQVRGKARRPKFLQNHTGRKTYSVLGIKVSEKKVLKEVTPELSPEEYRGWEGQYYGQRMSARKRANT